MSSPIISIIVPVYKAESYLHRCVDSILAQTFSDFEVLLIDDGSPDKSGEICDEYALEDSRVRVFHKENGGVGSARQCGIDNAVGIYSIHVDPDDWVEPTMLEELYNKAVTENADMVICDFYVSRNGENKCRTQQISNETSSEVLENLLFHRLHGSLWNKLIKLSCYTDFNVRFAENLNYCEDYIICVKLLVHKIKVSYLDKAFYYYDQIVNNNSITRKYTRETYKEKCRFIDELKIVLKEEHQNAILKNEASVAIECLHHKVLTKVEYKKIYTQKKWKLVNYISGYRQKIRFLIATLF